MLEILVNTAVRVLLLGAAIWLTLRLVRVRNPHAEVLAWRMLLLAGLALPVLLGSGLAPDITVPLDLPQVMSGGDAGAASAAAVTTDGAGALPAIALSIYLAVALLLVARLAAGLLSLRRVVARSWPAAGEEGVRVSSHLRSPATFGSVILLPSGSEQWPLGTREAVLAHERAHVRSHDVYWSWLAQLHAAAFWFNPLAWWVRRRLETLAETTSDDAVVAAHHDPIAYAALLLDFARQPNLRRVAMSVAESNVPGRIERLLAGTPPGNELARATRLFAFAALFPAIFLAAGTTVAQSQSANPASTAAPAQSAADSVRIGHAPDPDRFYPEAAKQAKVTASVLVEVSVDAQGNLVDVKVLEPLPANDPYGFGAAAAEVARGAQYVNPLGRTSSLKFKVKFALTSDPPTAASSSMQTRSVASR
jgi:TonB family protein